MKKRIAVILSAVLAVSMLAGCGKENSGYLKDIKVSKYLTMESDYKGLALTLTPKAEITEEAIVQTALNAYNNAVSADNGAITDRAVANGDTVNIDYEGKQDGVAFEGGTAQGQNLVIGSGSFIEGFEEGLIGVKPGETVELELTFPEGFRNAELAGQAVIFTVTVNYLYPVSKEEMKDEVIALLTSGEFTTVDSFWEYCIEYLEASAEYSYNMEKENTVIAALEGIATFKELPEALVAKYKENITKSLDNQAASYGVDADTFCTYYFQMDAAAYTQQAAEASARQSMIFQHIANEEGLNVSDEELEQSLVDFVEENGLSSVEELLADADKEDFREYFMFEKVVDFIVENAQPQ